MNELVVVRAGFFTTVQDRGRFGHRSQGVRIGGALDQVAFEIANAMAGNNDGEAVLEIAMGSAEFTFTTARRFALTGAEARATLDGEPVPAWSSRDAQAGQVLALHEPVDGVRTILAVAGGIDVPPVLESRSTDVRSGFGGLEGRALRAGDRVPLGNVEHSRVRKPIRVKPPHRQFDTRTLHVLPAPEYAAFDLHSQSQFWNDPWTVSPHSDRMGLRLNGEALYYVGDSPVNSHAVFPGVIQVASGGQPIVLLNDAQTTGGYPKIGIVRKADLWKLAAMPAGASLRFRESTPAGALDAQREIERYIREVEAAISARMSDG